MSTGRSNAMDALPRGSFLTYFRSPDHSTLNKPPPYSRYSDHSPRTSLLPRITEDASIDEESNNESQPDHCATQERNGEANGQGYSSHARLPQQENEEQKRGWRNSDALGVFGYTLLILLIVLNTDFLLSAYNPRFGLVNWYAYLTSSVPDLYKLQFCMLEQNREAPTSRVWRYVTADTRDCATDTMTVYAAASEEWKVLPEEAIMVEAPDGSGQPQEGSDGGDDMAKEGYPARGLNVNL